MSLLWNNKNFKNRVMVMVENKEAGNISDAEWEVMRIIWTLETASSSEVIKELQAKKDWSESTIKTLMGRLVQKGLLRTKKAGRKFIYSPNVSQTEMMYTQTSEMLDKMCNMHKGELLIRVLKEIPLSKQDIATLEEELDDKKKTAPDMVPCNCLEKGDHIC